MLGSRHRRGWSLKMGGTRSMVHLSYPVSVASMSHSSELRWWTQVVELEVGVREMRIFIGRYLRFFIWTVTLLSLT